VAVVVVVVVVAAVAAAAAVVVVDIQAPSVRSDVDAIGVGVADEEGPSDSSHKSYC
jgi:hypothetical protein